MTHVSSRRWLSAVLVAAGVAVTAPASAQFVSFSRCHGAYPCSEPFGLQYQPDPLIAGPWAWGSPSSAVSAHIELSSPPAFVVDKRPETSPDAPVEQSVRRFLRRHPAPRTADQKPPAPADSGAAPPPPQR